MPKLHPMDIPNELKGIETLLAASLLMNDCVEEEQQTAISLIDIALIRIREMSTNLDRSEGNAHA